MTPLRCAAFISLARASAAWAGETAAEPGEGELLTRFFYIAPSLCCGDEPVAKVSEPFSLYGLSDRSKTGEENGGLFLESNGIKFPPGANAVYFKNIALLGVVNTAENLRAVSKIMDGPAPKRPYPVYRIEARVVEYPVEAEGQLEADSTFGALQQKLGLRTIGAAGGKAESGHSVHTDNLQFPPHTAEPDDDADEWPPTPNAEAFALDFELFTKDAKSVGLSLQVRYAAPGKDGAARIRESVSSQSDLTVGHITKLKTFTVTPTGKPVRHLAILARCTRVDGPPDAEGVPQPASK